MLNINTKLLAKELVQSLRILLIAQDVGNEEDARIALKDVRILANLLTKQIEKCDIIEMD